MEEHTVPQWMSGALVGAALYHVCWSLTVLLYPLAYQQALHLPLPNYPLLWQYLGVLFGALGVGFAIAALDPLRHWPVVFVGLMAKLLGPFSLLHFVLNGEISWQFALTFLAGELVWCLPFALILNSAYLESVRDASPAGDSESRCGLPK